MGTNYSFVDFDDTQDIIQKKSPAHLANLTTLFRLPRGFSAHIWLNYSDEIEKGLAGGYVRLDTRLAKGFAKGKGEVSVIGQNLFGDHGEGGTLEPVLDRVIDVENDRKVLFVLDLKF